MDDHLHTRSKLASGDVDAPRRMVTGQGYGEGGHAAELTSLHTRHGCSVHLLERGNGGVLENRIDADLI